ncbi:DUF6615 family protein [Rhodococcus sp. JT-3]|uniref:DUF6615 family protein n=1 Tax=Rhodococcus sp. JT-3 TaxID=1973213 RepID=UPI0013035187|nr:DUF6615 family protein [Rhodococcus sp. JT-3]
MNEMFDAMNTVAAESWGWMEAGIAEGIGPGEESVTDFNLVKLRQLIPSLKVKKFTRTEEAGNGADWEWWIGSAFEEQWIKLRVQAKRCSHEGVRYEQLGHKTKNSAMTQYDTLIAKSLVERAIPFHVFFNGWPEDRYLVKDQYHDVIARDRRAARDGVLQSSAWDAPNWGCTMVSTSKVKSIFEDPTKSDFPRSLLDEKKQKDNLYIPHYLTDSTPWSHMLYSNDPGRTLTVREVAQNLHRMQGNDRELTDEEFLSMTYPNPSKEAEQEAYDGRYSFRKSIDVEEQERQAADRIRAQEFITSVELPFGKFPPDLNRILESDDEEESGLEYRLLLELDPERSHYFNPNYEG